MPFHLRDFWAWAFSDLTNNALRGVIAEYVVAQALDCATEIRQEWNAYDLCTATGLKIEVKSAAYVQSWIQTKPSRIEFDIRPTYGWDAATNTSATTRKRSANLYVFALLYHLDRHTIDPLNTDHWEFYILSTAHLNRYVPEQQRISLRSLRKLNPIQVSYNELAQAIEAFATAPEQSLA